MLDRESQPESSLPEGAPALAPIRREEADRVAVFDLPLGLDVTPQEVDVIYRHCRDLIQQLLKEQE